MKNKYIFLTILFIILVIILLIWVYGYYSGSCQINKTDYKCNNDFCLYKEMSINLSNTLNNKINNMLNNDNIKKRVSISTYPENLFNCALPNKSGTTITTQSIKDYCPELINYYENELKNIVSENIGIHLFTTDLKMPTTCAILIYDQENDWINWHYDYNYYDGRFFTVLIPVTTDLTCTKFQFKDKNNNIISKDLINNAICFEGNYLYHRASKLCKNQKRVILSCQYVTNNNMSFINKMRIKLKDFAYTGNLF